MKFSVFDIFEYQFFNLLQLKLKIYQHWQIHNKKYFYYCVMFVFKKFRLIVCTSTVLSLYLTKSTSQPIVVGKFFNVHNNEMIEYNSAKRNLNYTKFKLGVINWCFNFENNGNRSLKKAISCNNMKEFDRIIANVEYYEKNKSHTEQSLNVNYRILVEECLIMNNIELLEKILPHCDCNSLTWSLYTKELISSIEYSNSRENIIKLFCYSIDHNIIKVGNIGRQLFCKQYILDIVLERQLLTFDHIFYDAFIDIFNMCHYGELHDNLLKENFNLDNFDKYVGLIVKIVGKNKSQEMFKCLICHLMSFYSDYDLHSIMNTLIKHGFDANMMDLLSVVGDCFSNSNGNIKILQWLINHNVNLNRKINGINMRFQFEYNLLNDEWKNKNQEFIELFNKVKSQQTIIKFNNDNECVEQYYQTRKTRYEKHQNSGNDYPDDSWISIETCILPEPLFCKFL